MNKFFYPSRMAIFGVSSVRNNLAKNIIFNSQTLGYKGEIFAVGRQPGSVYGKEIITDPEKLPQDIDLAVILVPAHVVPETLDLCGRKGIRHAVISTAGFREFGEEGNQFENDVLSVAKQHGIRFIGPNCIGVMCTDSGLCTPFNPLQPQIFKKGPVSLIVQSGGITTQSAYHFSEEYVGFSKIISVGNKLNINELDLLEYLMEDNDTEQIHLYLESIQNGRELMRLAKNCKKPMVILKANVGRTASKIAKSHTAALSNNDLIVDGAMKQAGIVRVDTIHDMTVCAKALQLPPLRGNKLVAISSSGGFSVIIADACEKYGFVCPPLPSDLIKKIESFRRGGVIRMSNPMDFGDVHDIQPLLFALRSCLALDNIDGLILSYIYDPTLARFLAGRLGNPESILKVIQALCEEYNKPIALSFMSERHSIEEFKRIQTFPVFNNPVESVHALRMLLDSGRKKDTHPTSEGISYAAQRESAGGL